MTSPARTHLSRRNFLIWGGLAFGGAAVACSGLGYAATRTPEIATPELVITKDNAMNQRILVTYATRAGSTIEVANAIGETIADRGFNVEVKPVKANLDPKGYSAVLLGSAIRMGSWLPEMVDFIKANQATLKIIPVALFTVHILNTGSDDASQTARQAYLNSIRPLISTVDEVYFSGKIDLTRLSWLDRMMVKMVKSPVGDFRDWDRIRDWASAVV